jgi:FlaA1/EpsC-like NDP-sugar epimerase
MGREVELEPSQESVELGPAGSLDRAIRWADDTATRLNVPRRSFAWALYTAVAAASYGSAYLLRFELGWDGAYTRTFLVTIPILVLIRLATGRLFRLKVGRWRFVGTRDVVNLVAASTVGTLLFLAALGLLSLTPTVPRSVILIDWFLHGYIVAGIWLGYRVGFEHLRLHRWAVRNTARRALIIGAGEAGNMLGREMCRFPTGYRLVGYADDDRAKIGSSLHGVPIVGTTRRLADAARRLAVEEIIIAVPSAAPAELRRIVARCESTGLPFKVLPGIAQVLAGDYRLKHVREVQIEDLLGREPVELELPELKKDLIGGTVLITGAAGSIGSELARQVSVNDPGRLVLVDHAETALFFLERELRHRFPDLDIICIVGDVVDPYVLDRVFSDCEPTHVFHAAAYKHVSMMQVNVRAALRNNVLGSQRVAAAAGRYGARTFVLVSTDKAVQPTSVMGASKALAERAVLEERDKWPGTNFVAVRFGNVLGSNGSVVPILKDQIAQGQPLTITHPDATRYFMTIPEAVQLILQASLLPELRGQIAMLDMGEPVRIVDLAENLLRLAGIRDRFRDHMTFTGLRDGEKLHESLSAPEEVAVQTRVAKIMLVRPAATSNRSIEQMLADWDRAFNDNRDGAVGKDLRSLFPALVIQDVEVSRQVIPLVRQASSLSS